MKRTSCVCWFLAGLLATCALMPSLAEAQSKRKRKPKEESDATTEAREIIWRRDLSSALAESAAVGKGVFADFTADWCGYCKKLDAETFSDPAVIRAINKDFVAVKVDIDQDTSAKEHYGVKGIPHLLFLKPDGSAAHEIGGFVDAETFTKQTTVALDKLGPIVAEAEQASAKRGAELARQAYEKGKLGTAHKILTKLVETGDPGLPEVKEAKELLENITKTAGDQLADIKSKLELKDYTHVGEVLDELVDAYAGMPAGIEAKKIRDSLRSDPEVARTLRLARGEKIYQEAREEIERGRYAIALRRLEQMAKEYADLPIGSRFEAELRRLESDERIVRAARDEEAKTQCTVWLSLARTWSKNLGNEKALAKAKGYYGRIIETFPESSFAKTARTELEKLQDDSA